MKINLNGQWKFEQERGTYSFEGEIPGDAHSHLVANGRLNDPFYGKEELKQQAVGDSLWQISRSVDISSELMDCHAIYLDCEGVDTIADIKINDQLVQHVDNMFLKHRFNVKEFLRIGLNSVEFIFYPVREELEKRKDAYPLDISISQHRDWFPKYRNFLRKPLTHGGWDWGPCLLAPGIHRDIFLEGVDFFSIESVTHTVNILENGDAVLDLTLHYTCEHTEIVNLEIEVAGVACSKKISLEEGKHSYMTRLEILQPKLWWPNGYGEATLYEMRVDVRGSRDTLSIHRKIGFRTIEFINEADAHGECMYFKVNGVPIFIKGSNWIPGDSFDTRLEDDTVFWALESARNANQNMIRVWGGGLYERDSFYEQCDALGLLVWQDFMFACGFYPVNKSYLSSVREEVRYQMRRLMYHPSIALWCGNNECEEAIECGDGRHGVDVSTQQLLVEFDDLYVKTILPIVNEEDPARAYWPSSPSNGIRKYGNPQDPSKGDVHFWDVWHADKPFDHYKTCKPRFCSEFGFQSFSSPELMDQYIPPEQRNINSDHYEHHQRGSNTIGEGNLRIIKHIARQFQLPTGYENMIYVSQVLQSLSIKTAVEHWRRIKPYNMGTIIWQLNDIWPCASWSSLEYDGRWKMLHYAQKKFYEPLLVTLLEVEGQLEVWATSDVNRSIGGHCSYAIQDFCGNTFVEETVVVELEAMESQRVAVYPLEMVKNLDLNALYATVALECEEYHSRNSHVFMEYRYLNLKSPQIEQEMKEENGVITLRLKSDTFTPFVWIRNGDITGTWSDNGMHLFAGKEVALQFEPRKGGVIMEELKESLIMHNLYDAGM